ncbi:MAG TPA: phenylalanine--tRNA ligase subunit beta, partial [Rhodothermales bacterium]|nr:phenylalanine--tRNA ligase subunit beta [Rhodothermales bacterium]
MKLSYNWLRTYVPHELTPEQLAHLLTMEGLEVEDVETIGAPLEGVVVGEVLETRSHPNADRLTLCRVDLGGDVPAQIVCGAPNV